MALKSHALAAELIGTFLLTLTVSVSVAGHLPLPAPVVAGLTLGVIVFLFGGMSGAHVNPAVTIGLLSVKKISASAAAAYIVAQVLGALIAMFLSQFLTGTTTGITAGDSPLIAVSEAIGAAILVLGVSSVVHKKTPEDASGFVIGASLLLGALTASAGSNGIVNPAVAIGLGSISWSYILGPVVGGIVAAWVYRDLAARK